MFVCYCFNCSYIIKEAVNMIKTKNVTDDSFLQSIKDTVYNKLNNRAGIKKIAPQLNISDNVLRNKINPNYDAHLHISELYKIIEITNDPKPLNKLSLEFDHACAQNNIYKNISDDEIIRSRSNWEIERAQTCEMIEQVRANGQVTKNEIIKLKEEIYDDFSKQLALLYKLKACVSGCDISQKIVTLDDVLNEVCDTIKNFGVSEKDIGIRQKGYLKNICDLGSSDELNAIHLREIVRFTKNHKIIDLFCQSLNYTCVNLLKYSGQPKTALFKTVRFKWDAERGETDQAISRALEDESLTVNEYNLIEKEIYNDFKIEIAVLEML